jgi:CBS domain-containing protein
MLLREILQNKGSHVLTIAAHATLDDVVQKLVKNNCGSLVVCEAEGDPTRMVGIITERDILRACADRSSSLEQMRVADRMSRNPVTCFPDDSIQDAMGVMTERRIRHLPIVNEAGQLVGMVSIGDLVKHQHDQLTMENHYLKTYIQS